MEGRQPTECNACHTQITVKHILIECPKYEIPRRNTMGLSPGMDTILGDDNRDFKIIKIFK